VSFPGSENSLSIPGFQVCGYRDCDPVILYAAPETKTTFDSSNCDKKVFKYLDNKVIRKRTSSIHLTHLDKCISLTSAQHSASVSFTGLSMLYYYYYCYRWTIICCRIAKPYTCSLDEHGNDSVVRLPSGNRRTILDVGSTY